MKKGKASGAVLDRSVYRQLHSENPLVLQGPAYGISCGRLQLPGEGVLVCTSLCDTLSGAWIPKKENEGTWQRMALCQAANDLAAAGAVPSALTLQLLLPETMEEARLKGWMRGLDQVCGELNIQIINGHTETAAAVSAPVMTGTLFGLQKKTPPGFAPGMDLVMIGWAGLAGTAVLAAVKEEELTRRYPLSFLDKAKALARYLYAGAAMAKAWELGAFAMYALSGSGILGGLWELAEAARVGLEISWKRIPIKQETVEISEFYGLNPYCLHSGGSAVIGTENGQGLADALTAEGISAAVIGRTTKGNDRILQNGEDIRYLNRPIPDELLKVIG